MREYTIVRRTDRGWNAVPSLPIDNFLWKPAADISASAQICYDDEALYVRLTAREEHIRAEETELLGSPCEDSCLEFFFCPYPGDTRYFNIEMNPNCCMYLGMGHSMRDLVRLIPQKTSFDPKAERTEDGWRVTYRVPCEFIRIFFPEFKPESGREMRANCYKCGDLTAQEHYIAWNPVPAETFSFHQPEGYGLMRFE